MISAWLVGKLSGVRSEKTSGSRSVQELKGITRAPRSNRLAILIFNKFFIVKILCSASPASLKGSGKRGKAKNKVIVYD